MEYCKLRCKANKEAFKEIVDEINNGGGGGGGSVTKVTFTNETEYNTAIQGASPGDIIVMQGDVNNTRFTIFGCMVTSGNWITTGTYGSGSTINKLETREYGFTIHTSYDGEIDISVANLSYFIGTIVKF